MNREQQTGTLVCRRCGHTYGHDPYGDGKCYDPSAPGAGGFACGGTLVEVGDATPPATPEPPKTDAQIRDWLARAEAGRLTVGEIRAWLQNPMVAHGEVERWVITQLLGMVSQSPAASGDVERLRNALIKVRAHTAYRPGASRDLLAGLLASIERIVDAALRAGDRPTPGGTTP